MRMGHQEEQTPPSRETTLTPQTSMQPPPKIDYRRQAHIQAQTTTQFQHSQMGDLPTVPHNEFPTDGMTMFCRTAPPSERSSAASPMRPSSRDSQSEYSNPTSFSSQELPSGKQSPVKQNGPNDSMGSPMKQVQKKRSGFFSNSPFRRKSKSEKHGRDQVVGPVFAPPTSHNTWSLANVRDGGSNTSPIRSYARGSNSTTSQGRYSGSPEPVDPRANFQLNVGPNVFDVASPDSNRNKQTPNPMNTPVKELDPIAQALAELKGINKQSSVRISADRYHGIATPAPPGTPSTSTPLAHRSDNPTAQHDTPPPSYHDPQPVKRLDLPRPAFTSKQMHETTRKYVGQTKEMYGSSKLGSHSGRSEISRSSSPLPIRSVSPRPGYNSSPGQATGGYTRGPSPNPHSSGGRPRQTPSTSPAKSRYSGDKAGGNYSRHETPNDIQRGVSPQPQFTKQERPNSSAGSMALQLAEGSSTINQRGRGGGVVRPMSYYGGQQPQGNEVEMHNGNGGRTRSKSVADGRQYTKDGRPILQFGKISLLHAFCQRETQHHHTNIVSYRQQGQCIYTGRLSQRS